MKLIIKSLNNNAYSTIWRWLIAT